MSLIQTTGNNPQGEAVPLAVSGVVIAWNTPLAANGQTQSDIIPTAGYTTIFRLIASDQASATGGIKVEFFDENKQLISDFTLNSTYNPADGAVQPVAFMLRGSYVRYTYTNGATAQTRFNHTVWLIDGQVQTAAQLLSVPTAAATFSQITKSMLNAFDGTVYRPLEWIDGALKVSVNNPQTSIDVSTLATKDNQTNGSQHVVIVNGNNQIYGAGTNPFNTSDAAAKTVLDGILAKIIASPATEATLSSILTKLNGSLAVTGAFYQTTQPVSAATLPLPTGAATAAKQDAGLTSLGNLDTKTIGPGVSGSAVAYALTSATAQTIAANPARKGVAVTCVSGVVLVGVGYTATAALYTYRVVSNGMLELPEKWAQLSISLFSISASNAVVTSIL